MELTRGQSLKEITKEKKTLTENDFVKTLFHS